ncbi:MAG: DinB family protein [Pyrinomonadaceae bacterium]|nr:DinB family protein [Pyrinomonadaceae bacterium]MBP6211572.1 DinB family protein [Pyrinomonadaceae bacterium]
MQYNSIAEIYSGNENIRTRFLAAVASVSPDEASALPEGEKWTIEQIVEHVALVNGSMSKICSRLLSKAQAEGKTSGGLVAVSDDFMTKSSAIVGVKVEAPEFVRPEGGKPIGDSLAEIEAVTAKFNEIRELFETFDGNTHKFPHPFFGDMSAIEWLVLVGGHEMRHAVQIEKLAAKLRD